MTRPNSVDRGPGRADRGTGTDRGTERVDLSPRADRSFGADLPGRRAVLIATVGAVGAATAGCVRIPDHSGVRSAPRQTVGAAAPDIRTFPDPPVPGLSPQGIAAGFIEASAIAGPEYSIARQYLTQAAAAEWDPEARVTIFTGGSWKAPTTVATPATAQSVVLTGTAVGRVDGAGLFAVAASGAPFAVRFGLRLQDGQWRIADPPPGRLIAADDFARGYTGWQVMFLNPAASSLVPDALYLPNRGMDVKVLATRLLAGPSAWLGPVVRTAVPQDAALSEVTLSNGVARVRLDTDLSRLPVAGLDRLSAQVVTTLRQLGPDISAVTISSGGKPIAPGQLPAQQPVDSWGRFSPDVLPDVGGDLSVLAVQATGPQLLRGDPASLNAVAGVPAALFASGVPRSVAVNAGSGALAVVTAGGTAILATSGNPTGDGGPVHRVITGRDLTRPQFDRAGLIWTVDGNGTVLTWNGSVTRPVGVDLRGVQAATSLALPGARVQRLALARDGQRAAVVVARPGGPATVLLMRVRRTGGLALDAPRLVTTEYPQVLDLAWLNATELTLLARDSTSTLQVAQLRQDGSAVQELGSPADGISVAAGPGNRQIVVGGADGTLYVYVRPFPSRFVAASPTTPPQPPSPSPLTPSPVSPSAVSPSPHTSSPRTGSPSPSGSPSGTPSPSGGPSGRPRATGSPGSTASPTPRPQGFYAPVYPG